MGKDCKCQCLGRRGGGEAAAGRTALASPSLQAPGEAEAAADLIDMGPDPAATGGLSSQLEAMSKYGAPLQF